MRAEQTLEPDSIQSFETELDQSTKRAGRVTLESDSIQSLEKPGRLNHISNLVLSVASQGGQTVQCNHELSLTLD